jgi:DNA-binding CsgD family transcriptional regulator
MNTTAPSSFVHSSPKPATCARCGEAFKRYGAETICFSCRKTKHSETMPEPGTPLSFRERQILTLLSAGINNKEIAARLILSEGTVKVYVSRLFAKTGATSRHDLAMYVMRDRLDAIAARLKVVQQQTAGMPAGNYGGANVPELAGQALKLIEELRGEPS